LLVAERKGIRRKIDVGRARAGLDDGDEERKVLVRAVHLEAHDAEEVLARILDKRSITHLVEAHLRVNDGVPVSNILRLVVNDVCVVIDVIR
jgi:hypothetical protein